MECHSLTSTGKISFNNIGEGFYFPRFFFQSQEICSSTSSPNFALVPFIMSQNKHKLSFRGFVTTAFNRCRNSQLDPFPHEYFIPCKTKFHPTAIQDTKILLTKDVTSIGSRQKHPPPNPPARQTRNFPPAVSQLQRV